MQTKAKTSPSEITRSIERQQVLLTPRSKNSSTECRVEDNLLAVVPVASVVATGLLDRVCVRISVVACKIISDCVDVFSSDKITCGVVVADREVRCNVAPSAGKTLRGAVDSGAANRSGVAPDYLREVAPDVEVIIVEAIDAVAVRVLVLGSLAVVAGVVVGPLLCVVEELSDNSRDVAALDASGDVLAVSASIHGPN